MTQKYTILFDLDGTLVDTAPDLMNAHNHVMKKYGYPTKSTEEIRNLVGQGAGAMLGRSIWGQAKKEFIITLLPILTFFPNTTYGLITTFFPIFVSSEKKIVSGPIIFTPDLVNLLRNFI